MRNPEYNNLLKHKTSFLRKVDNTDILIGLDHMYPNNI